MPAAWCCRRAYTNTTGSLPEQPTLRLYASSQGVLNRSARCLVHDTLMMRNILENMSERQAERVRTTYHVTRSCSLASQIVQYGCVIDFRIL